MLKRRGARTDPCGTTFLRRRNLLLFPFPVVRVKLRLLMDHVPTRQQSRQLLGEAAMPYNVVGCCEIDKHSSGLLLNRRAIIDVICQQGDLVYGRAPVSKARLLLWEQ